MSELSDRIAEVLREHRWDRCWWKCEGGPFGSTDGHDAHVAERIETALTTNKWALVKLPEPDSERYEDDEHEPTDRLAWRAGDYAAAVWDQGEVQVSVLNHGGWYTDEPITPAVSRDLAAALLAAAAAAVPPIQKEQP